MPAAAQPALGRRLVRHPWRCVAGSVPAPARAKTHGGLPGCAAGSLRKELFRTYRSELPVAESARRHGPIRMTLSSGTRLGPYEVTAQIGVGGMGEVYRATDTNLKRAVALKVLPSAVATDPERLARFQREAEVLASLNHPNIAQIHGLERTDGMTALVMELVEGPTLADRVAQGAIAIDEALPIARQIAEALEAAHERGIIHRDLKPANIKVRPDGTVKVLDFGGVGTPASRLPARWPALRVRRDSCGTGECRLCRVARRRAQDPSGGQRLERVVHGRAAPVQPWRDAPGAGVRSRATGGDGGPATAGAGRLVERTGVDGALLGLRHGNAGLQIAGGESEDTADLGGRSWPRAGDGG